MAVEIATRLRDAVPGLRALGSTTERDAEKRTRSGLFVREADYGQMKGRDRNAPCPCRSGRKWKRCHGRAQ